MNVQLFLLIGSEQIDKFSLLSTSVYISIEHILNLITSFDSVCKNKNCATHSAPQSSTNTIIYSYLIVKPIIPPSIVDSAFRSTYSIATATAPETNITNPII